jgi:Uncharacterized conserved protein (DUF2163)/Phage conserved hypothetical protein BR0599
MRSIARGKIMKTPWYEVSPGATAALLATRSFVDVDCYTFKLAGAFGGVTELLYSAGPLDVTAAGNHWSAQGPTFDQARAKAVAHYKTGLDVDTWQVVVAPRLVDPLTAAPFPDAIGSQPWLAAAQAGALDNAEVQVDRAIAPAWPAPGAALAPTGIVTIFYGTVGEIDVGRSQAAITIYSHLKKLANLLPRNLFQASCVHTLFDQGCTLSAANFAVNGTVSSNGPGPNQFNSAIAAPSGSGTYALGRVVMTSGASQGYVRTVRSWSGGFFSLIAPFPFGVAAGDSFTAYPGCDKSYGTCALFRNAANFGGCLSIPAPETAV